MVLELLSTCNNTTEQCFQCLKQVYNKNIQPYLFAGFRTSFFAGFCIVFPDAVLRWRPPLFFHSWWDSKACRPSLDRPQSLGAGVSILPSAFLAP